MASTCSSAFVLLCLSTTVLLSHHSSAMESGAIFSNDDFGGLHGILASSVKESVAAPAHMPVLSGFMELMQFMKRDTIPTPEPSSGISDQNIVLTPEPSSDIAERDTVPTPEPSSRIEEQYTVPAAEPSSSIIEQDTVPTPQPSSVISNQPDIVPTPEPSSFLLYTRKFKFLT